MCRTYIEKPSDLRTSLILFLTFLKICASYLRFELVLFLFKTNIMNTFRDRSHFNHHNSFVGTQFKNEMADENHIYYDGKNESNFSVNGRDTVAMESIGKSVLQNLDSRNSRNNGNIQNKKFRSSSDHHNNPHRSSFSANISNNNNEKYECSGDSSLISDVNEKKYPNAMAPLDFNCVSRSKTASPIQHHHSSGFNFIHDYRGNIIHSLNIGTTNSISSHGSNGSNGSNFYDYGAHQSHGHHGQSFKGMPSDIQQMCGGPGEGQENHSPESDFSGEIQRTEFISDLSSDGRKITVISGNFNGYEKNSHSRPGSVVSVDTDRNSTPSPSDYSPSTSGQSNESFHKSTITPTSSSVASPGKENIMLDSNFSCDSSSSNVNKKESPESLEIRRIRYKETWNFLNKSELIGVTLKTVDLIKRNQLLQRDIDRLKEDLIKMVPSFAI
ncbi:uncharacterized protein LOC141854480 isoform X2 [Brevipalpus obovatus]|uniref:uncharacterized protein LOC141854480 isoform X2 n=1 Tax=Brevipalpus obovatus TaxID=246614 RepID=UPI003D9E929F